MVWWSSSSSLPSLFVVIAASRVGLVVSTDDVGPFGPEAVRAFVRNRCGPEGASVWTFEGELVDPLSGRPLARVEGVELVRRLAESAPNNDDDDDDVLGDLAAQRALRADGASWDAATTVLSRRLFCYRSTSSSNDGAPTPLASVRTRPGRAGRERRVSRREAVACYDTATTFVSRDGGRELFAITEFPDGRYATSRTTSGTTNRPTEHDDDYGDDDGNGNDDDDDVFFAYSLRAGATKKPRRAVGGGDGGPALPPPTIRRAGDDDDDDAVSPSRTRLVQFGPDRNDGFVAREDYRYSFPTVDAATTSTSTTTWRDRLGLLLGRREEARRTPATRRDTVRYVRHGEAPPWYGPGRPCRMELVGRRVPSLAHASPTVRGLVGGDPTFADVRFPLETEVDGRRAVRWFREDAGRSSSSLWTDEENKNDESSPPSTLDRLRRRGERAWRRIVRAGAG